MTLGPYAERADSQEVAVMRDRDAQIAIIVLLSFLEPYIVGVFIVGCIEADGIWESIERINQREFPVSHSRHRLRF